METTNNSKKVIFNQNEISICGRIGSIRRSTFKTKNGFDSEVAHLSVATNERVLDHFENGKPVYAKNAEGKSIYKDEPIWHDVTVYKGQWVAPFDSLKPGVLVRLKGRMVSEKFPLTNDDKSPVLRNGTPYMVTRSFVLIDGSFGSLGVVKLASASDTAETVDEVDDTEM